MTNDNPPPVNDELPPFLMLVLTTLKEIGAFFVVDTCTTPEVQPTQEAEE